MSKLELCSVPQDLIGTTQSMYFCFLIIAFNNLMIRRTKIKLSNGEMQVKGDQWPIFLYADYTYDFEDPWNGLLHSGLLVLVSFIAISYDCY